jgi:AcrR family transcriptional regulator
LSLRDGLLDAADSLLDDRPWAKISMGEVARRAGVSRQSLYNEFGGRAEFAEALLVREAERLLAGPEREIAAHPDDPRAAITGRQPARGGDHLAARRRPAGGGDDAGRGRRHGD